MAITTRKSAFARYTLTEDTVAKMDTITFENMLRSAAFKPIDEGSDTMSCGWTNLADINDSKFETQTVAEGGYYTWGLRIDKRAVPTATLRNETSKAIADEIRRTGAKLISRDRKKEIRDLCYLRLLARMPAVPRVIQCVYDGDRNMVYFGSTSKPDMLTFEEIFHECFDVVPMLLSPSDRAVAIMGDAITDALSNLHTSNGNIEYPLFCDFLLWLWYKTETFKGGNFTLPSGEYTAVMEDHVSVVEFTGRDVTGVIDMKAGEDCEFADIKYGLWKFDRTVSKLRLVVTRGTDEFTFNVDAKKHFAIDVKTPPLHLNGESVLQEGPFLEKMSFLDVAQNFMDDMYALFVKARLSSRWQNERKAISVWLEASAPECERAFSEQIDLAKETAAPA